MVPQLIEAISSRQLDDRRLAATALDSLAKVCQDSGWVGSLPLLERAHDVLESNDDSEVSHHAPELQRAIKALRNAWWQNVRERVVQLARERWQLTALVVAYCALVSLSFLTLLLRPLVLLRFNDLLSGLDYKLPDLLGGSTVSVRYLLVVGFFHHHSRVLGAWVSVYATALSAWFEGRPTVEERRIHIATPLVLNGEPVPVPGPASFQDVCNRQRACIVIWGEGGAGKTSLACQLGRWAISENRNDRILRDRRAIPVLLEHDLDPAGGETALLDAIRAQLTSALNLSEPIRADLVVRLLRDRRLLVIVDHLSELTEATRQAVRPDRPAFPANLLVVTSRIREEMQGLPRIVITPVRIQGNRLSSFMELYLTQRGKRDLFDDQEYFEACGRLSSMVGDRDITILLAKLYAEQMIAAKESSGLIELPETIPDLMLSYLNEVNRNASSADPDDREVHRGARVIAWESLSQSFVPVPASIDNVLSTLGAGERAKATLIYLESRLRLVQTVGPARDRIRLSLDPVAEYLAALQLLRMVGDDEAAWRVWLEKFDAAPGAPSAIIGFLLALRDTMLAKGSDLSVCSFVVSELALRAGLDPSAVARARVAQRIKRLTRDLFVPEAEDRASAARALAGIGQLASDALPRLRVLLTDGDESVRATATLAVANIGGAS
jgi:HEAT repeat protein